MSSGALGDLLGLWRTPSLPKIEPYRRLSGREFRFSALILIKAVLFLPRYLFLILWLRLGSLTVRGESPASTETVPAPAGQGAIRVHTGSMCPNRNAVRRDAGTVECRDDFCHGLLRKGGSKRLTVFRKGSFGARD